MEENGLDSLIQRYAGMAEKQEENSYFEDWPDNWKDGRILTQYPDGYQRRSPVQQYRTISGYRRRIRLRLILSALFLMLIVLLLIALFRSGIFRM